MALIICSSPTKTRDVLAGARHFCTKRTNGEAAMQTSTVSDESTGSQKKKLDVSDLPLAELVRQELNRVIDNGHTVVAHVSRQKNCDCSAHQLSRSTPFAEDEVFQGPQGHIILNMGGDILCTPVQQEVLKEWAEGRNRGDAFVENLDHLSFNRLN